MMDFKPVGLCATIKLIVDDTNAYVTNLQYGM